MFIGLTNLVPSPFQRLGVKPTYLSLTLAPSPLDHEFKKQWLVKFWWSKLNFFNNFFKGWAYQKKS